MPTRHTRLTLLILEQVEADEAPRGAPAIETTGELVRARPIRTVRTADSSTRLARSLDGLAGWLAKVAS